MDKLICGIDEAGRGPVIGPMVVAGVWIKEEEYEVLKEMAIKDSKKHTRKQERSMQKKFGKCFFIPQLLCLQRILMRCAQQCP